MVAPNSALLAHVGDGGPANRLGLGHRHLGKTRCDDAIQATVNEDSEEPWQSLAQDREAWHSIEQAFIASDPSAARKPCAPKTPGVQCCHKPVLRTQNWLQGPAPLTVPTTHILLNISDLDSEPPCAGQQQKGRTWMHAASTLGKQRRPNDFLFERFCQAGKSASPPSTMSHALCRCVRLAHETAVSGICGFRRIWMRAPGKVRSSRFRGRAARNWANMLLKARTWTIIGATGARRPPDRLGTISIAHIQFSCNSVP